MIRTVGVAVPIAGFVAAGQSMPAILGGIGALYAGLSSYAGIAPVRAQRMVTASFVMAAAAYVSTLASFHSIAAVIVTFVLCLAASMAGSLGQSHDRIAIHVSAIVVLLSGTIDPHANPGMNAVAILVGGLCQTLACSALDPVNPYQIERASVAAAFEAMADFLREEKPEGIPATVQMIEAAELMEQAASHGFRNEHAHLVRATQVAETVRAALVGYVKSCHQTSPATDDLLSARLEQTAIAIRAGNWTVARLFRDAPRDGLPVEACSWLDVIESALSKVGGQATSDDVVRAESGMLAGLRQIVHTELLDRARLSQAFRYATMVALAMVVARVVPLDRVVWFPFTVALILRSSYSATLARGVRRVVGTLVGVAFASLVETAFQLPPSALLGLTVVAVWLVFTSFQVDYAVFSFTVTLFVVFLLSSRGAPEWSIALVRLGSTAAGALVAYLATLVWPIWESRQVEGVLRDAFGAQAEYGREVWNELNGAPSLDSTVHRRTARALRLEAEKLVETASQEPRWGRKHEVELVQEKLAALTEGAAEILAIHAQAVGGLVPTNGEIHRRLEAAINRADRFAQPTL